MTSDSDQRGAATDDVVGTVPTVLTALHSGGLHLVEALLPDRSRLPVIELTSVDDLLTLPDMPRTAFITTLPLEQDDFRYTPRERLVPGAVQVVRPDSTPSPLPEVPREYDLRELTPELRRFEVHLGELSVLVLMAPYQGAWLAYSVSEPWWDELQDELEEAKGLADQREEEEREAAREREQHALQGHYWALEAVTSDPQWVALAMKKSTTQRALLLYARDAAPDAFVALGETRCREYFAEQIERVRQGR